VLHGANEANLTFAVTPAIVFARAPRNSRRDAARQID
jgi:hypothetical protein